MVQFKLFARAKITPNGFIPGPHHAVCGQIFEMRRYWYPRYCLLKVGHVCVRSGRMYTEQQLVSISRMYTPRPLLASDLNPEI